MPQLPFIFVCWLLIMVFSCGKEKEEAICNTNQCQLGLEYAAIPAEAIVDSSISICYFNCAIDCQLVYSTDEPYKYIYPCFNPLDPNQLAYYRKSNVNPTSAGFELWIKDFCTGEQKMITDLAFYGIDWSIKDWLIFTSTDQNIWKVKSNGDSLTQLTSHGSFNRYPRWNPEGNKIAYEPEIQGETFFYIMDEFGNHINTIDELAYSDRWCWTNNNEICYTKGANNGTVSYTELNIYNTELEEIRLLHTIDKINIATGFADSVIFDIEKLPNENSIVWSASGLIGKTNLTSGSFQVLKDKLYHERFYSLTVRPNSPEILANKGADYYVEDCTFYTDYGFFLIDQDDGGNHRKILLD